MKSWSILNVLWLLFILFAFAVILHLLMLVLSHIFYFSSCFMSSAVFLLLFFVAFCLCSGCWCVCVVIYSFCFLFRGFFLCGHDFCVCEICRGRFVAVLHLFMLIFCLFIVILQCFFYFHFINLCVFYNVRFLSWCWISRRE